MLGHVDAGAGDDKRRGGGNIERALLIAAGAASVEHGFRADVYPVRLLAHHPRRAGDLLDGFAFHAQRREKRRHLQRRRFSGHDLVHHVDGVRLGKIDAIDQLIDRFANVHDAGDLFARGEGFRVILLGPKRIGDFVRLFARCQNGPH